MVLLCGKPHPARYHYETGRTEVAGLALSQQRQATYRDVGR
ncbi:MAG: hypothetical protein ABW098_07340 [Candidatus Thiodiazotropha sp.]